MDMTPIVLKDCLDMQSHKVHLTCLSIKQMGKWVYYGVGDWLEDEKLKGRFLVHHAVSGDDMQI